MQCGFKSNEGNEKTIYHQISLCVDHFILILFIEGKTEQNKSILQTETSGILSLPTPPQLHHQHLPAFINHSSAASISCQYCLVYCRISEIQSNIISLIELHKKIKNTKHIHDPGFQGS